MTNAIQPTPLERPSAADPRTAPGRDPRKECDCPEFVLECRHYGDERVVLSSQQVANQLHACFYPVSEPLSVARITHPIRPCPGCGLPIFSAGDTGMPCRTRPEAVAAFAALEAQLLEGEVGA